MDYEKKYNEALERAKKVKHDIENIGCSMAPDMLEVIFPELAESEDERIRKKIIEHLEMIKMGCVICTIDTSEEIAWLEKQKEPKDPFDDEQFSRGYEAGKHDALRGQVDAFVTEYNKGFDAGRLEGLTAGYNKAMKEVDEQQEQKPKEPGYKHEDYFCERCQANAFNAGRESVQKEQKPNSTEDMPYVADEHFFEREPADTFKYRLAEYMTRCCTKKEGPYGYEYGISAESILKMAEEELLKRGVVQKPAWKPSEEQMEALAYASQVLGSDLSPRAAKASEELESLREQLKRLMQL